MSPLVQILSELLSKEEIYLTISATLALLAIASAVYMLKTRSLVYAAYALALVGLFNAGLFALLGFALVAAIQVVIYIGAAVLFIILSYSLIGEVPIEVLPIKRVVLPATLLFIAFFLFVHHVVSILPGQTAAVSFPSELVIDKLVSEYATALIILFLVAGTSAIEAVVIAKREFGGEQK